MLTLAELSRAVRVLEPQLVGRRIQDVAQPDEVRVVLTAFGGVYRDAESSTSQRSVKMILRHLEA